MRAKRINGALSIAFGIGVVAFSIGFGVFSIPSVAEEIPVVPLSVMRNNVPAPLASQPKKPKKEASLAAKVEPVEETTPDRIMTPSGSTYPAKNTKVKPSGGYSDDSQLVMKPGVNQIIPISIGHPNRIVTPFGSPSVTSTSLQVGQGGECGEICIKENVVYVATNKEYPLTMFITEKGTETRALSLTMVPKKIPPREVFLKLDSSSAELGMSANKKAKSWEQSQPYVETIRTLFRKLALGEIPNGYALNKTPSALVRPNCAQPGIDVNFNDGQVLLGHHLTVFVGVARNVSDQTREFVDSSCGNWNVAAVTSWPNKVLEPGQRTEVYVAVKQGKRTVPTKRRPSLIDRGVKQ